MAPKTPSLSHRPSKDQQVKEASSEEESESDSKHSGEDEGNSSDETVEGSSEDEVGEEIVSNNQLSTPVAKSGSKSISQENGWISDPESEGTPSDYKLQPISKPSASSAKRIRQEVDESHVPPINKKKSKFDEKRPSSVSNPGSGCISRLWSDEDEIALLNGMVDYGKANGLDYSSETFYNFIKGELQGDFSRVQLRTKIRRIKERFLKKGENGSDPVFSKPHEDMMFELSKKIWGDTVNNRPIKNEDMNEALVKAEEGSVEDIVIVKKENDGEEGDFWSNHQFLSSSFKNMAGNFPSLVTSQASMGFLKERLSLIGNAKAKELDQKWRQLAVEEAELNHKMLTLMMEQVKMALNQ